jgi:hypothetical protein
MVFRLCGQAARISWTSASLPSAFSGIDDYHRCRIGSAAMKHVHPKHRVGMRHVKADVEQAVRNVDVFLAAGLSVAAEGLL